MLPPPPEPEGADSPCNRSPEFEESTSLTFNVPAPDPPPELPPAAPDKPDWPEEVKLKYVSLFELLTRLDKSDPMGVELVVWVDPEESLATLPEEPLPCVPSPPDAPVCR